MLLACVCKHTPLGMHVCSQKQMSSVFLYCAPHCLLTWGLSLNLGLPILAKLVAQQASVSMSPTLWLLAHATVWDFRIGAGVLNSGSHAWTSSTLISWAISPGPRNGANFVRSLGVMLVITAHHSEVLTIPGDSRALNINTNWHEHGSGLNKNVPPIGSYIWMHREQHYLLE